MSIFPVADDPHELDGSNVFLTRQRACVVRNAFGDKELDFVCEFKERDPKDARNKKIWEKFLKDFFGKRGLPIMDLAEVLVNRESVDRQTFHYDFKVNKKFTEESFVREWREESRERIVGST